MFLVEGFAKFKKEYIFEPSIFSICDMKVVDINYDIPHDYFILINKESALAVVKYEEFVDGQVIESGLGYIIYKIGKNENIFNFYKSEEENGRFVIFQNEKYVIQEKESDKKFTIIFLDDIKVQYKNYCYKKELFAYKNDDFILVENNELKLEFIGIICGVIDQIDNIYYARTFRFNFNIQNIVYFGYCLFQLHENHAFCSVLVSRLNSVNYFYVLNKLLVNNNPKSLLQFFGNISCGALQSIEIEYIDKNSLTISEWDYIIKKNTTKNYTLDENFICKENFKIQFYAKMDLICMSLKKIKVKIMIYILRSILLEDKIIILSENVSLISDIFNFTFSAISPFEYTNLKFSLLPKKLYMLFDSPFPYIFGVKAKYKNIKKMIKNKKITVLDIDNNEIYNKQRVALPFEEVMIDRMYNESWFDFISAYSIVLKNNIDIAREKYISKNIKENIILEDLFLKPSRVLVEIKNELKPFFKIFFETKIFQTYCINNKQDLFHMKIKGNGNYIVLQDYNKKVDIRFFYQLWYILCLKGNNIDEDFKDSILNSLDFKL